MCNFKHILGLLKKTLFSVKIKDLKLICLESSSKNISQGIFAAI